MIQMSHCVTIYVSWCQISMLAVEDGSNHLWVFDPVARLGEGEISDEKLEATLREAIELHGPGTTPLALPR